MKYNFCKKFSIYHQQLQDNLSLIFAELKKDRGQFDRNKYIAPREGCKEILRLLKKGVDEKIVEGAMAATQEEIKDSTDKIIKELSFDIINSDDNKHVVFCNPSEISMKDYTNEYCRQIGEILKRPDNLITSFSIAGAGVGPENFRLIANALKDKNNKVTYINMYENKLGPEGAKMIADVLKDPNNKLKNLYLWANDLGSEGSGYIIEALGHKNCDLNEIGLNGDDVGEKEKEAYEELKKLRPEIKIKIGYNKELWN